MNNKFYCICERDCKISGIKYYKDVIYCIVNITGYTYSEYNIYDLDGIFIGYMDVYNLEWHFTTVMYMVDEIDKEFNIIMDEDNL